jgi:heme oxygenase
LIKEEPALLKRFRIKQATYSKQLASVKRALSANLMIIDDAQAAFSMERGVIVEMARVLQHLRGGVAI